jgi:hypothetical protein
MWKLLLGLSLPLFSHAFDPNTAVFIGSSTIEFWSTLERDFKPIKTLNLGVRGTTCIYLLQHADD